MNLTLKRLLGAAAAVTTGAAALLGAGAGTAGAAGDGHRAHCDRAERDMWSDGPGTDVIGHGCDMSDNGRRWYTIDVDTLVLTHYKGASVDDGVGGRETVHDGTVRCMGYISDNDTVRWFGCPPS
ncbi:hypothetical protein [Streptomyces sp. NPDC058964]|uniref:hypothetical protein n=1 Tax=Streptomyces sp. NPDC058964 TaxID=3346681 RepID=UPI003680E4C9